MISEPNNCSLNKHNTFITSKSHAKGYLEKLSYILGNAFDVTDNVKPNSDLEIISVKSDIKQLTNNVAVIACGGSIVRNNSKKGFHSLNHFVHNYLKKDLLLN
jgi:hypothetical protein